MNEKYYRTKISKPSGNQCVNVYLNDNTLIDLVKEIIRLTVHYVKYIVESYDIDTNPMTKIIRVTPEWHVGFSIQDFERTIQNSLNKVDEDVLKIREEKLLFPKALAVCDKAILKIAKGECDKKMIDECAQYGVSLPIHIISK